MWSDICQLIPTIIPPPDSKATCCLQVYMDAAEACVHLAA